MPWLRKSYVIRLYVNNYMIPISILTHPLLPIEPLGAPCCCHPHFSYIDSDTSYSCTDLDITFYTSALALFGAEVLYILQSQGQTACLIAGL